MVLMQSTTVERGIGNSIYRTFNQFPAVCFTMAFLSDIAYWRTATLMWQNFSSWLLFTGLVTGGIAAVALVIHVIRGATSGLRLNFFYIVGTAVVWLLALLNSLIHAGDGWTAVVPWGLTLSAVTFIAMLIVLALGGPLLAEEPE